MIAPRVDALVERVVLVVLDGLRSDAIEHFDLQHFRELASAGASTLCATTVAPSVTACAMASLLSGATPHRHGCQSDRFTLPRPRGTIHPLPRVLAEHGFPSSAFFSRVPWLMRRIAKQLASAAGVSTACFDGVNAHTIVNAATDALARQRRGLVLMHWPDGDRAGHETSWMSRQYGQAVQGMDEALGRVMRSIDLLDPGTLLIALADHGGGGHVPNHHDSAHPLDRTIPVAFAGGGVRVGDLGNDVMITDVPATILHAFGIALPESYAGRALTQVFREHRAFADRVGQTLHAKLAS